MIDRWEVLAALAHATLPKGSPVHGMVLELQAAARTRTVKRNGDLLDAMYFYVAKLLLETAEGDE